MSEVSELAITPRAIISTVAEQVILSEQEGGWERVLRKCETILAAEWEITLDTELTEA